jgi:hypothetical protein
MYGAASSISWQVGLEVAILVTVSEGISFALPDQMVTWHLHT